MSLLDPTDEEKKVMETLRNNIEDCLKTELAEFNRWCDVMLSGTCSYCGMIGYDHNKGGYCNNDTGMKYSAL